MRSIFPTSRLFRRRTYTRFCVHSVHLWTLKIKTADFYFWERRFEGRLIEKVDWCTLCTADFENQNCGFLSLRISFRGQVNREGVLLCVWFLSTRDGISFFKVDFVVWGLNSVKSLGSTAARAIEKHWTTNENSLSSVSLSHTYKNRANRDNFIAT